MTTTSAEQLEARLAELEKLLHMKTGALKPPIPDDPRLQIAVKRADAELQLQIAREEQLQCSLLQEPAWSLLLTLFTGQAKGLMFCVGSACANALVPQASGQRHIKLFNEMGWLVRHPDHHDSRRIDVWLTTEMMNRIIDLLVPEDRVPASCSDN